MSEEDKVELNVEIPRKVLTALRKELKSEYGTITQDILNKEVEAAIIGYIKAKKVKLIGPG